MDWCVVGGLQSAALCDWTPARSLIHWLWVNRVGTRIVVIWTSAGGHQATASLPPVGIEKKTAA